jgi:16S rRNA (adenine1518-N6/adenine1519-N6)-dimethyltransferase
MKGPSNTSHHVQAKKSLGQNFLHDQEVLRKIAALATPEPGSGLVEVGPGTGNLTAHLLELGVPLVLIERDRRLPEVLRERFGRELDLVQADAAEVDWPALLARPEMGPRPVVVGNLPYYAALPILFAALEARPAKVVAMLQKEVAMRLVAQPSTPDYGQISVKLQLIADIRIALKVGRGAFSPVPKVESAVVTFTTLPQPRFAVPDLPRFSALVTAGFAQRRKTLVNSLGSAGLPAPAVVEALQSEGLDVRIRGEAMSVAQWAGLATRLDPVWRSLVESASASGRPSP